MPLHRIPKHLRVKRVGTEEKREGKKPLGRPSRRWKDNREINFKEVNW